MTDQPRSSPSNLSLPAGWVLLTVAVAAAWRGANVLTMSAGGQTIPAALTGALHLEGLRFSGGYPIGESLLGGCLYTSIIVGAQWVLLRRLGIGLLAWLL